MTTWNLKPANESAVDQIARALELPRAIARMLVLRGYETPKDAQRFLATRDSLDFLMTPIMTPGMEKAVKRIKRAVAEQERFVIYGDYDCDGVTSATVLYRYLKRGMKANCEAYLPDRFKDGYGVTPAAVERLAKEGVKLILTCDNGISALPAAAKAKELGVELVITDHHQVPDELPDVHAIVHPQLEFNHLRDLAGVGVAYLFCLALEGGFNKRMETFLDFVTLGTVGDVVPLDGPNRGLVWAGLERYRQNKSPYPGIAALGAVAKSTFETLTAQDVGFQLVPRLNAAGRLETPDIGFKLLSTNDKEEAAVFAEHLDNVNKQRRDMSADLEKQVCDRLDAEWDFDAEPFVVLADPAFHHGITGIIAGRVKEKYRVPVLLFSGHGDGQPWKASGRAPDGVHLYDALHAAREHLLGFGGHAGAAGCAAPESSLVRIREILNQHVHSLGWRRPADVIWLDAELPFAEADDELLEHLDGLEPYGQKNPMPVFGLLRARVLSQRVRDRHLFLQVDDGQTVREVIAWGKGPEAEQLSGWIRLTYTSRINTFRGERKIQLVAGRIEPTEPPPVVGLDHLATPQALALDDRRGDDAAEVIADLDSPVTLYALPGVAPDEPLLPAGSRVLDPFGELEAETGHVVLLSLPHDEAAWAALTARASRLTLAWDEHPEEEPPLTPTWLQIFYMTLGTQPLVPLGRACSGLRREERQLAVAGVRILREAGLMVERAGRRQLLAAPPNEIGLAKLAAYQGASEARAFRQQVGPAVGPTLAALLGREADSHMAVSISPVGV